MKRLLNVELTTHCPASCAMCPRNEIQEMGSISLDTVQLISEKIKDFGELWEISIAGRGEPTIHPDFYKLTEILHRQNEIPVAVVTTGAHVNDDVINAFNNNVDKIRISISSINRSIFSKVHIGLDYDKTWANINQIIDKCDHSKIVIHFVGGEIIYSKIGETVDYLRNRGISNFYIFPLWNRAGSMDQGSEAKKREQLISKYNLASSESEYLNSDVNDMNCGCRVGNASITLNFKGNIGFCFQDFSYKYKLGNIHKDNISDMLKKRVNAAGKMDICKGCNSSKELVEEY